MDPKSPVLNMNPGVARIHKDIATLKTMGINDRGYFDGDISISGHSFSAMSFNAPNLYDAPSRLKKLSNKGEYDLELQRFRLEQALDLRDSIVAELANLNPDFKKAKKSAEALVELAHLPKGKIELDHLNWSMGITKIGQPQVRYDGYSVAQLQETMANAVNVHLTLLLADKTDTHLLPDVIEIFRRLQEGLAPSVATPERGTHDDTTTLDQFILKLLPTLTEQAAGVVPMIVELQRKELLADAPPHPAVSKAASVNTPRQQPQKDQGSTGGTPRGAPQPVRSAQPTPSSALWSQSPVKPQQGRDQAIQASVGTHKGANASAVDAVQTPQMRAAMKQLDTTKKGTDKT